MNILIQEHKKFKADNIRRKRLIIMKDKNKFSIKVLTDEVLKNMTSQFATTFRRMISNNLVYTIDISDILWVIGDEIREAFPNLEAMVSVDLSERYQNGYKTEYFTDQRLFQANGKNGSLYPILYKNILIVLNIDEIQSGEGVHTKFSLKTLREPHHVKTLHKFVECLVKRGQKRKEREFSKEVRLFSGGGFDAIDVKLRTFDDVFLPQKQKNEIQHALKKYTTSRDWYIKNNIPNHFGIMLYGPPGTGKSSIAQAISKYINAQLSILIGDNLQYEMGRVFNCLGKSSISDNKYRVLLIEDIDTSNIKRKDIVPMFNTPGTVEHYGLGALLNNIDGIASPSNIIYIFTTNHVENLDPALIRPGRIDLKLEIGYATEETFKEFIKFHYGTNWLAPINVRDGLTFAELQRKVMEGFKLHELIDYVSTCVPDDEVVMAETPWACKEAPKRKL